MRSLRTQLLVSHLLLLLPMLALVTGTAIFSFVTVERFLGPDLERNVETVRAASLMQSALAQQRESFALLLAGAPQEAATVYNHGWASFEAGCSLAEDDATEREEYAAVAIVRQESIPYRKLSLQVMEQNSLTLQPDAPNIIRGDLLPQLLVLQKDTQRLLEINHHSILKNSHSAGEEARAAIRRSIAVTLLAVVLALLLAQRMVRLTLTPLAALAKRAERIAEGDLRPAPKKRRLDEIEALVSSFDEMAERLGEMRLSAARRLHRAERMSDAALEYLYDPVLVADAQGRVAHMNKAAERLFGPTQSSPRLPIEKVVTDRRIVRAIENAVERREVSASEDVTALVPVQVGEMLQTFRLRVTPMEDDDGKPLGSVAVLEDVTHIREIDRLKTEFIGVAAHELRTPVTSLLLSVQLMEEGAVGPLNDSQKEIVLAQKSDLERLEKLMRDLLDVTRLEAGTTTPRLEWITVEDVTRGPMQSLGAIAEHKHIGLTLEVIGEVEKLHADRGQIGRVLTNLIANAIRHTPSGGAVTVRAKGTSDEVTFLVEDNGEGIPTEYLKRIFDRFVQVPGATQGGAGLGLSIAQNIVRAHHGRMDVESELGKGSVFSFTLPRDPAAAGKE